MANRRNVLFLRGTDKSSNSTADADDDWDDTVLVKAYDKAINLAKDQVAKRIGMDIEGIQEYSKSQNHKKSNPGRARRKWAIGSPCRAEYSKDGEIYEAIVTEINEETGICQVTFVGYGNAEKKQIDKLMESEGLESQMIQQKSCFESNENSVNFEEPNSSTDEPKANRSTGERMDYDNSFNPESFNSSYEGMPPAPPLPPQLMSKLPDNDEDALSSMLMSWYISGFHTGYYHGMKQSRSGEKRKK